MEASKEILQQQKLPASNPTLTVDFSWMKWRALITENGDPATTAYVVDFKMTKPHLAFRHSADGANFATGNIHAISTRADCEIHGKAATLKPLKRFKTSYTHLSHAYSDTDTPVPMTWTSTADFKTWDFICLDQNQQPVAKYSSNIWALKKVGQIEFMGPKAASSAAVQDELVVTGMTLFYCMALRANNILSLFGAVFSRPGKNVTEMEVAAAASRGNDAASFADNASEMTLVETGAMKAN